MRGAQNVPKASEKRSAGVLGELDQRLGDDAEEDRGRGG
jgi:hypothetical protein